MGLKRRNEFWAHVVRIALTSGLSRKQVESDLGVGHSTLKKWVTVHRGSEVVADRNLDLARKNERLRRENRILREDSGILKRRHSSSQADCNEVQVHRRASRCVLRQPPKGCIHYTGRGSQ